MTGCPKHTRPHLQVKTNRTSMPLSSRETQAVPPAGSQVWPSDVVSLWRVGGSPPSPFSTTGPWCFTGFNGPSGTSCFHLGSKHKLCGGNWEGGTTHSVPSCQQAFRTKPAARIIKAPSWPYADLFSGPDSSQTVDSDTEKLRLDTTGRFPVPDLYLQQKSEGDFQMEISAPFMFVCGASNHIIEPRDEPTAKRPDVTSF